MMIAGLGATLTIFFSSNGDLSINLSAATQLSFQVAYNNKVA